MASEFVVTRPPRGALRLRRGAPNVWGFGGHVGAPMVSEEQDGARDLAGLHGAEGLVDVAERAATADHLVEHELALTVELQVEGNVHPESVGAHPGRLHLALRTDGHPRELD